MQTVRRWLLSTTGFPLSTCSFKQGSIQLLMTVETCAGSIPTNAVNSAVVDDKPKGESPDTKVNVDDAVVAKAPDGEEVDFKKLSIEDALKALKVHCLFSNSSLLHAATCAFSNLCPSFSYLYPSFSYLCHAFSYLCHSLSFLWHSCHVLNSNIQHWTLCRYTTVVSPLQKQTKGNKSME